MQFEYLILGAGPAGLTFANKLKEHGCSSFQVLEKESEPGGLCRSRILDRAPLDIGGGHFLDVRRPEVNDYLFQFMPEEEWNLFTRDSRIELNGSVISHPLEANIWQLPLEEQVEYLKSIAQAGCNTDIAMPQKFTEWIHWKLGHKIANDYMLPYNSKMFGKQLDNLGTYWMEKLPNVSFEDTLYSCLEKKPHGKQPGHARFYYPKKYGYGELWKRMADNISGHILYNTAVTGMDFHKCCVTSEKGQTFYGSKIITTIPWTSVHDFAGMPRKLRDRLQRLHHTGIIVEYHPETLPTPAHWIYIPDPALKYHRILVRHNFCSPKRGFWTETNADRCTYNPQNENQFYNEYAYPLNTIDKPVIMKELLAFSESNNVYGLGRWGEHEHYNSDLTVAKSISLYQKLTQ